MNQVSKVILKGVLLLIILSLVVPGQGYATSNKKVITIEDIKLWRSHSVTLSDNGRWYTVLYTLIEKPDPKEKKKSEKKDSKKKPKNNKDEKLYGKNALTDVLYIKNYQTKKEYQIKDGTAPLFSPASDWIAYYIVDKLKKEDEKDPKKEPKKP